MEKERLETSATIQSQKNLPRVLVGREFDSGWTNTQGLKNKWVESAAFVITSANG